MSKGTCSEEGCGKTGQLRRGMCEPCYRRWIRRNRGHAEIAVRTPQRIAAEGKGSIPRPCVGDECDGFAVVRGLCRKCYNRLLRTGTTEKRTFPVSRCRADGCNEKIVGWRLCVRHYQNWRFTGDPLTAPPPETWLTRFMAKIDRRSDDDCWPWLGALNSDTGYGYFNQDGKTRLAHQVAYEIAYGEIPAGMEPDHRCSNRPCVNWHHLEAVTHRENVLRSKGISAMYAHREHCPNDHPYTPDSTIWTEAGRRCAICLAAKMDRRNRTKREARMRRN